MKISNRQIKDMELCEKSNGAKDCFECSANVCLMKYETDLKRIEELEAKATAYDNAKEDLELAQAVKLIFEQRNIIAIEPSYDFMMNLDGSEDYISDAKELINWYREQKESENKNEKI